MDADHDIYSRQMRTSTQLRQHAFALFSWQLIRSLRGLAENLGLLNGDVFDVDTYDGDKYLVGVCGFRRFHLFHFMVDDLTGAEFAQKRIHYRHIEPRHVWIGLSGGVDCDYVPRRSPNNREKEILSTAKKSHRYIRDIGKKGNPNSVHYGALVQAELTTLKGRKSVVVKQYESAILLAPRRWTIHDQGVANGTVYGLRVGMR